MTDTTPEIRLAALHAALDWADDHAAHTGNNHLPEGAILSVASKFANWITTGETPRKPSESTPPAVPPAWGGVSADAMRAFGADRPPLGIGEIPPPPGTSPVTYTGEMIAEMIAGERGPTIPSPADLAARVSATNGRALRNPKNR